MLNPASPPTPRPRTTLDLKGATPAKPHTHPPLAATRSAPPVADPRRTPPPVPPRISSLLVRDAPTPLDVTLVMHTADLAWRESIEGCPDDATRDLWVLAKRGDAKTIQALADTSSPDDPRWHWRNASGETLLMSALKHRFSLDVIETLSDGPPALCAGLSADGQNILHYVVEYADAARLAKLLDSKPAVAGYIDLPGGKVQGTRTSREFLIPLSHDTPLAAAFYKREDDLVSQMTALPVEIIDQRLQHGQDVFPFDDLHPKRTPVVSRSALIERAIVGNEPMMLEKLLRSMPPSEMASRRETLTRAVMLRAAFPSVRVVANYYGTSFFSPFTNGDTALHAAAPMADEHCAQWLLGRPGHQQALEQRGAGDRTPLLNAAEFCNGDYLRLLILRRPDGLIRDIDRLGHGMLRALFYAHPYTAATQLHHWIDRVTPRDKTATLALAIRNLVKDTAFRPPSPRNVGSFAAHLNVIERLLQQPAGEIDVDMEIAPNEESIFDMLESDCLTTLVHQARQGGANAYVAAFDEQIRYDNASNLALAETHRRASLANLDHTRR